jgi:hypothetical protein
VLSDLAACAAPLQDSVGPASRNSKAALPDHHHHPETMEKGSGYDTRR